jgi:hypothetical protein
MDQRFTQLAALAANQHGVFTAQMATHLGISDRLRLEWEQGGYIERLGTHSHKFVGTPTTWKTSLSAALGDLGRQAAVAGRSAAALNRLDGFTEGPVEVWVPRSARNRTTAGTVRSCSRPLRPGDIITIDGLRCVTAERLILDSLLYNFDRAEIHNAIDSAIRLRLVDEQRLRRRIEADLPINSPQRRQLVGALVDTGGESALERRFLAIIRQAGLPRPRLQRVYRSDGRVVARVDAEFPGGLVVELAGHATHGTRRQLQHDAQRRTELALLGKRVIDFTYEDVYRRPQWMLGVLRSLRNPAA